jgi:hypothetical protein
MLANARDEHLQLVCDDASVGVLRRHHGDTCTASARRNEDDSSVHLDDSLSHFSGPKPLTCCAGQTMYSCRNSGQVVGVLSCEPTRAGNQNPVA